MGARELKSAAVNKALRRARYQKGQVIAIFALGPAAPARYES
jgi:hypothetical protein